MAISIFGAFRSTVTPLIPSGWFPRLRLLVDPTTGAPAGVLNPNDSGADGVWTPIDVTAAQVASPSAAMLADLNATFRLSVAPYSRYYSTGTALVGIPGLTGAAGATGGAAGAPVALTGGAGNGIGAGGPASLTGGHAGITGFGGPATVSSGAGTNNQGGVTTITSGSGGFGYPAGAINITVGAAGAVANGSAITLTAGAGIGTMTAGGNIGLIVGAGGAGGGAPGEITVNGVAGVFGITWTSGTSTTVTPPTGSVVTFFQADRPVRVKAVSVTEAIFGTSETFTFQKDTGTTAPGAGTAICTAAVVMAASNTRVPGALVTTVATVSMVAGDRLSFTVGGVVGGAAGLIVSALLTPA
jgi:hypothetical protein